MAGRVAPVESTAAVDWSVAREAVAGAADRVAALVRSVRRPDAPAVGEWNAAEVAAHLSHAVDGILGMAQGGGGILPEIWGLSDLTGALVRGESERDLSHIADRIQKSVANFLAYVGGFADDELRTWFVPSMQVPLSTLTCHVLNELLVHGRDIAKAEGTRWPIPRTDAGLVLNGFLFPVVAGLGRSLVDQAEAAGVRATFDIRVRGGGRAVFRFEDGDLSVAQAPPTGPVDCHLSVDPTAFMLVAWGRISQYSAIARGQLLAWGRRPWLGLRLRTLMRNP